jgi:hypothetical protein
MLSFRPLFHRFVAPALVAAGLAAPVHALQIDATPNMFASPLPRQYAPGTSVTLQVIDPVAPSGQLVWLHNDQPIPGATRPTLTLSSVTALETGNYQLQATTGSVVQKSNIVTFNVLPFPASPVDLTFTSSLSAATTGAHPLAFADDGSMVVLTSTAGGASSEYVRLRADGSRDASFALAPSMHVLTGWPDGRLITAEPPYRMKADGSPAALALPTGFDASKPLTGAWVQSDGKLLIAQDALLARLNADDSPDASFTFVPGTMTPRQLSVVGVDGTGRIYVSTRVQNPVPTNWPSSWTVVVRLKATGELDAGFATQQANLLTGSLLVAPLADGRIFYYSRYHGYVNWRILRDDGTADPGWSEATLYSDAVPVIDARRGFAYVLDAWGAIVRYRLGATGLEPDPSFYPGTTTMLGTWLVVDPQGRLLVGGYFSEWDGHPARALARLRTDLQTTRPPSVSAEPVYTSLANGSTVALRGSVFGTGPLTYEWLALDGQPLPADHYAPELSLSPFRHALFGRYQLKVIGPGGGVLSNVVDLSIPANAGPYLVNLSGRAHTGQGEDMVTAGLVTKTDGGKVVGALVRGVGPTLLSLGVKEAMANPAIDVFNRAGTLVANNDQWAANPETAAIGARVGAFPLEPGFDAALQYAFPNGVSTMMLKDQGMGEGVGMLEIYQSDTPTDAAHLRNLSLRARTAPGDSVAVAGFVIADPLGFGRSARLLLRAVGPTLAAQGISRPLENPVLDVFNAKGERVASNDDWAVGNTSGDQATLAAAMATVGAFALPATSQDAALLLDLPAGAYTLHANGGTGVVLLEIYLMP